MITRPLLLTRPLLIIAILAAIRGQAQVRFDAATIKLDRRGPGDGAMRGGPGTNSPERVTWQKVWLQTLLAAAFHVDLWRVSGPAWISGNGAQLYALAAVVPPGTSKRSFELMLQALLVDQFKIRLHHEPKTFPAFDLVVAPGGAKLRTSANQSAQDAPLSPPILEPDGFPVLPPGHGERVSLINGYHGRFQNYTMGQLAEHLINWVSRSGEPTRYVIDKTGLMGEYDFTLKFDQDEGAVRLGAEIQAALGPPRDSSDGGTGLPSLFRALEQQLGLKLIKAKDILLDTIVIDQAERIPAGN